MEANAGLVAMHALNAMDNGNEQDIEAGALQESAQQAQIEPAAASESVAAATSESLSAAVGTCDADVVGRLAQSTSPVSAASTPVPSPVRPYLSSALSLSTPRAPVLEAYSPVRPNSSIFARSPSLNRSPMGGTLTYGGASDPLFQRMDNIDLCYRCKLGGCPGVAVCVFETNVFSSGRCVFAKGSREGLGGRRGNWGGGGGRGLSKLEVSPKGGFCVSV